MVDETVFAHEIFGFHAQQAAEKLLKAWIATLGRTFPLTHDIGQLLEVLKSLGVDMSAFHEIEHYTPYAVVFLYGAIQPDVDILDREESSERIRNLLDHVQRQLSEAKSA